MANTVTESYWNDRKDSLSRAQQLSRRDIRGNSTIRNYKHAKTFGRYSNTPPNQLPALKTPPRHKSSSNLRNGHYNKVPPVIIPQRAKDKPKRFDSDDDSWDDDIISDSDDESRQSDRTPPVIHHHHYPPHPSNVPPFYMYPPPHEGYPPNVSNSYQQPLVYPLKVNRRNTIKHPKHGNSKTKKRVRYAKNPGIRIISPSHDDGAHQFDYIDPQPFNNIDIVISEYEGGRLPHDQQRSISSQGHMVNELKHHFNTSSPFAQSYVSDFVDSYLEGELIPDLLIDVVTSETEAGENMAEHIYRGPSFNVCMDFIDSEVDLIIQELVHDVVDDMETHYIGGRLMTDAQTVNCASALLDNTVCEMMTQLVRESMSELVDEHLEKAEAYDNLMGIVDEIIGEESENMLLEVEEDIIADDLLDDNVINPVIDNYIEDIVFKTFQHYENKIKKKELKAIEQQANPKLIDGFMLDYLLTMIARQNLMTEEEATDKLLDNLCLTTLLTQSFCVKRALRSTVDNKLLRKHHEKIVTDVALDVITNDLIESLDEDLQDLDEWEQGFDVELDQSLPVGLPDYV